MYILVVAFLAKKQLSNSAGLAAVTCTKAYQMTDHQNIS